MRAAIVSEPGGPEVFRIQEIEEPTPGPEEVLVDVKATALNRADLLQRRGRYPGPPGPGTTCPAWRWRALWPLRESGWSA